MKRSSRSARTRTTTSGADRRVRLAGLTIPRLSGPQPTVRAPISSRARSRIRVSPASRSPPGSRPSRVAWARAGRRSRTPSTKRTVTWSRSRCSTEHASSSRPERPRATAHRARSVSAPTPGFTSRRSRASRWTTCTSRATIESSAIRRRAAPYVSGNGANGCLKGWFVVALPGPGAINLGTVTPSTTNQLGVQLIR